MLDNGIYMYISLGKISMSQLIVSSSYSYGWYYCFRAFADILEIIVCEIMLCNQLIILTVVF